MNKGGTCCKFFELLFVARLCSGGQPGHDSKITECMAHKTFPINSNLITKRFKYRDSFTLLSPPLKPKYFIILRDDRV